MLICCYCGQKRGRLLLPDIKWQIDVCGYCKKTLPVVNDSVFGVGGFNDLPEFLKRFIKN